MNLKLLTLHLLLANAVYSQNNLIINGGFETHVKCPNGIACLTVEYVNDVYNPTDSSPDLFSLCSTSNANGVPTNEIGFQNPKEGSSYVGIMTLLDGRVIENNQIVYDLLDREYIQLQTKSALKKNNVYYLSYYLSLADSAYAYYTTHNIGAYFSTTKVDFTTNVTPCIPGSFCGILPFTPQIENTKAKQALNSSTEWIKVEGYYTAQGGEQYITIGNFRSFNDTEKDINPLAPPLGTELWNSRYLSSYYYIDDVYLEELGPVGMVDEQGKTKNVYYNTSTNTLHVSERGTLVIYNMQGVKVKELLVVSGEVVSLKEDDLGGARDRKSVV